jgi:hypothetical protein
VRSQSFKQEQMALLRKSGSDAEYAEREQLLADIVQLMEEAQRNRAETTIKDRRRRIQEDNTANRMLEMAMGRITRDRSALTAHADDDGSYLLGRSERMFAFAFTVLRVVVTDANSQMEDENIGPSDEVHQKGSKRRRLSTKALLEALQPSVEERQLFAALTNTLQPQTALARPQAQQMQDASASLSADMQKITGRVERIEADMKEIKRMLMQALGLRSAGSVEDATSPR